MKRFLFLTLIIILLIGCGSENTHQTSTDLIETETTKEDSSREENSHENISDSEKIETFNYASYYTELYNRKDCRNSYIENNLSLCFDEKNELKTPLLLSRREEAFPQFYPFGVHILPFEYYSGQRYSTHLAEMIQKNQYRKDLYCEDFIKRVFLGTTFGELDSKNITRYMDVLRKKIEIEPFNIRDSLYFKLSVDEEKQSTLMAIYQFQDGKLSWDTPLTTIIVPNQNITKAFSFIKGDTIVLQKENQFYEFNTSEVDSTIKATESFNGWHLYPFLNDDFYMTVSIWKREYIKADEFIFNNGKKILRIEGENRSSYSYSFLIKELSTGKELTTKSKELIKREDTEGSLHLIGPLFINGKWDGKTFIGTEEARDRTFSSGYSWEGENVVITEGSYKRDNTIYTLTYEEPNGWTYVKTPILNTETEQGKYTSNKYYFRKSLIENLLAEERLSFQNHTNYSAKITPNMEYNILPIIDDEIYFYIQENEEISLQSFSKVFNIDFQKYKTALEYFYQPFYSYLEENGKLHIFSLLNTCQNVSAEYVVDSGYAVDGKIDGRLFHYVVDLTKEDYLKPISEEKVLSFQW